MRGLLLLPLLLALGCSDALPGPQPRAMDPNEGVVGQELRGVAIEGSRFFVRVRSNFDDPAQSASNLAFLARLVAAGGESHSLSDVTYVSEGKLTVTVPGTLAMGVYTLEIVDPWGRKGTLPEAFQVGLSADLGADSSDAGVDQGADTSADQGVDTSADQGVDAPVPDVGVDAPVPDVGVDAPVPDVGVDAPVPDVGVDAPQDQAALDVLSPDVSSPDVLSPDTLPADVLYTGDVGPPTGTVQLLHSDPFGDGSTFAYVFAYRGLIHVGPRADGTAALRMQPDGSQLTKETFVLPADVNGNKTDNSASPPYSSLGAIGCQKDTLACGPDNENARGLFTSGTINGQEWLVAAGGRSNKGFEYIYMTSDSDTQLDFRFVDLHDLLGGGATTASAVRVFADRVYLGVVNDGGKPFLTVLYKTPPMPGLDAAKVTDADDLKADSMPGVGNFSSIDSFGELSNRLYLANPGGCLRTTTTQPRDHANFPGDWAVCTPSAGAYAAKTSVATTKPVNLEPADKAIPYFATFKGRLYMGRNTTAGPQLWGCVPANSGDAAQCDPGDWFLVASNSVGDFELTQFNHGSNKSIGLLVATATHLYVGFENGVDGVMLFRSSAAVPSTRADFTGLAGCSAAQSSCAGLGGNGLGLVPKMTRILDGVAATFGARDYVYLVVNDGTNAVRLLRVAD